MFNYEARQLFIVHPRGAGGGILANILSLDSKTAAQDLKNYDLDTKLDHIQNRLTNNQKKDAHPYGLINFMFPTYVNNVSSADWAERYVQKCHYFELFSDDARDMLARMPNKVGIGLCYSQPCLEELKKLPRGNDLVNDGYIHYYLWIYNNLRTLLPTYFGINCIHTIEFRDLLDLEKFLDHIRYISDELDLEIDLNTATELITEWHNKIRTV